MTSEMFPMPDDRKEWSPSMPLRADATEEQIFSRELWLKAQVVGTPKPQQWLRVVREFADARVSADRGARSETAWLIEFTPANGIAHFWVGEDRWQGGEKGSHAAIRFARREDAEKLVPFCQRSVSEHDGPVRAIEHEWAADSRAPREGTIASDSRLAAILHQLERGEAAEGDVRDVAWCAKALRAYIEAEVSDAPREGKPNEAFRRAAWEYVTGDAPGDDPGFTAFVQRMWNIAAPPVSQPEPSAQEKV